MPVRNNVPNAVQGQPVSITEENEFRQEVVDEFTLQAANISAAQAEIASAQALVTQLQTDVTNQTAIITQLDTDLTQAEADIVSATNLANANASDITALSTAILSQSSSISSIQASLTQTQSDITQAQNDISGLTSALSALSVDVTQNQTDIAAINSSVSALTSQLAALSTTVTTNSTSITSIQADITSLEASVTALQSDLTALENTVANMVAPVFGQNYQYVESLNISISTVEAWTEKLSMVTGTLPVGVYRIGWTFQFNSNSTGDDFLARVQLNNNTIIFEMRVEPKEVGGSFGSPATGSDQQQSAASFEHLTLLTASSVQIDLDWATSDAGDEASIWNAKLEIWRVS